CWDPTSPCLRPVTQLMLSCAMHHGNMQNQLQSVTMFGSAEILLSTQEFQLEITQLLVRARWLPKIYQTMLLRLVIHVELFALCRATTKSFILNKNDSRIFDQTYLGR